MNRYSLPLGAAFIIDPLQENGFEAYVVGGCVRDRLLGRVPKDWDICTSASPQQVKEIFGDKRVIETGLQHGTVTIVMPDGLYEVTTFRVDGAYSDNRHPDEVRFVKNLEEDLARRDFTINAMAYNDRRGLVDPFGGEKDLADGVIRCVGDAAARFHEDGLRLMRALRFASKYGFRIEDGTAEAIHSCSHLLRNIAVERINTELCRLLCGKNVLQVLLDYPDVITEIIPEMKPCVGFDQNNKYHEYNVYDHIAHAVSNYTGEDTVVNVTLLLHDIGKPNCYTQDERGGHFHGHGVVSRDIAEGVLTKLRFDNQTKADVLELVLFHDSVIEPTPKTVRRWLNKIGPEQFYRLLEVRMADILAHSKDTQASRIERCNALRTIVGDILEQQQCYTVKDLAVNGYDVMQSGVPEGKEVGAALNEILDKVIGGELENERSALLAYLSKRKA